MNKKIIWGVVSVIAVVVIIFVASRQGQPDGQTLPNNIIKVGVIAPLTSYMAEFGEATKNGIFLAEINSVKNNKVQFIFEDSAYDPKKAISAYNKLANIDKVDMIIDWGSATTQAEASIVKNFPNIPLISISSMTSASVQNENIIRFFERPNTFANEAWGHLRKLGLKKIAIIKTQNQWLNSVYEEQVSQARSDESIDLVDDVVSFSDMDFRTAIAKIKNSKTKYDAVGVYLGSGQIGQFYKQASEVGLNVTTFGTDFFESQSDIDTAGGGMNGAFYPQYDVSPAFKDNYYKEYRNYNQIVYAGLAYDLAKIIIEKNEIKSGSTLMSYLKSVVNEPGVIGSYTYKTNSSDSDRYMQIPLHIKEVRDFKINTLY
ncbi:MAG: ABC transporter substrate-binding protein [Candidatus Taylorbacteria bacterium]